MSIGVVVASLVLTAVGGAVALAAPQWRVDAITDSVAAPSSQFNYLVEVRNVGTSDAEGESAPIRFSGTLPEGLRVVEVFNEFGEFPGTCSLAVRTFSCESTERIETAPESASQYFKRFMVIAEAEAGAKGLLTSQFEVSGGDPSAEPGLPSARTAAPVSVSEQAATFGVRNFDSQLRGADGSPFMQAGGHPFAMSTSIAFNTYKSPEPLKSYLTPVEATKDIEVKLPAGFTGDPQSIEQCTIPELANAALVLSKPLCPPSSQVGVVYVQLYGPHFLQGPMPVFNVVPSAGEPARLGFNIDGVVVLIDLSVRTGGDYGLTATVHDVPEGLGVATTSLTLWGDPTDPAHTPERACAGEQAPWEGHPTCPNSNAPTAFLRNPTSCTPAGVGLATSLRVDSWQHPGAYTEGRTIHTHGGNGYPYPEGEWGAQEGTTGCSKVPFNPEMTVTPDTAAAGSPAGYTFDLGLPQSSDPQTIGQSDVRKIEVALPAGAQIDPSSAAGLEGCSEAQVALHSAGPASCPDGSKLASVSVKAPALKDPLTGGLYLATPYANPSKSLVAVYMIVQGSGVTVKLPGSVKLDPATGQATTIFDETPQLPFSDVHIELKSGPRAAFSNPATCGNYNATAQLEGWSEAHATLTPPVTISHGADGGACAAPGFAPSFTAGTTGNRAGTFSPFVLSFSRNDSEQQIAGLTDTFPPGVSAVLKGVAKCSEAEVKAAEAGTGGCPQASRIGSVTVASGAGPDPYFLKGTVYLTGPYNGGPFGEAVVVPAVAGPFHLGNVVVRGSIRIDPHTAQPSVVSDPFPQFVGSTGIPTDIRRVDVSLDRTRFTFNPTNCSELKTTATLTGAGGASANVSSRFQAAECRSLGFKPSFKASVAKDSTFSGKGAGFTVNIATKGGPDGGEANIAKVNVRLPKILPSRLETLQKACTEKVFAANPAACPAESRVGTAQATTPLLASPLSGPAILVSHGGAGFPDLVLVLQGEGVRIDLTGKTEIKGGYTFSRFNTVPDAPVSSFALSLPRGRYSALAANGNMCKQRNKLTMPTTIVAQNGAVVKETTKIAVSHCAKAKKHSGKHKTSRRK